MYLQLCTSLTIEATILICKGSLFVFLHLFPFFTDLYSKCRRRRKLKCSSYMYVLWQLCSCFVRFVLFRYFQSHPFYSIVWQPLVSILFKYIAFRKAYSAASTKSVYKNAEQEMFEKRLQGWRRKKGRKCVCIECAMCAKISGPGEIFATTQEEGAESKREVVNAIRRK